MTYWWTTCTELQTRAWSQKAALCPQSLIVQGNDSTRPYWTSDNIQFYSTENNKERENEIGQREERPYLREQQKTLHLSQFHKCSKQGCEQRQQAHSPTLMSQRLSEGDSHATLSLFLLTDPESPSKRSTLLAIWCLSLLHSFIFTFTCTT